MTEQRPDSMDLIRRSDGRLQVLSKALRAFADAAADPQRLYEKVARLVAEAVRDTCVVLLLDEDGATLNAASVFDPDAEVLAQVRTALEEPISLDTHPIAKHVHTTRAPVLMARVDLDMLRPPRTTARYFALIERTGMHSLLAVPMVVSERAIGLLALSRRRKESPPFDDDDLALAENLASHAALAVTNSRLFADSQREMARRQQIADRLRVLADASHDFAATTYDYARLLDVVATRLGEIVGDVCMIRAVAEDGEWIEPKGAVYHRDPAMVSLVRTVQASAPQRVGEGVSGRVVASGQGLLLPHVEPEAIVAAADPPYRPLLERLRVASLIALPLTCRGQIVGIANLMRSEKSEPYTEDDFQLVRSVADHAAIAIANARSFANERAARAALETATKARREAEGRFARLAASGVIGIVVSSLEGSILEINDTLLHLVGYSREEILSGRVAWASLTPPEFRNVDAIAVQKLRTLGVEGLREKEYIRKDGRRVSVLIGSAVLEGTSHEVISFVVDVTAGKEAQAAVERLRAERVANAKFRTLLEAAPDAMVITSEDGTIVFANGQCEALFGYAGTDLIGRPFDLLVPERSRNMRFGQGAGHLRTNEVQRVGAESDVHGLRKDGTEFPIEVNQSPLETEEGLLVSNAIRDITGRKEAERRRARLAAIVNSSDDAIMSKTLDGTITSWNAGAERILQYAAGEIVGRSIAVLVPPGRENEERQVLDALARGEVQRFDTKRRRKDGVDVDVSVAISPIRDSGGVIVGISDVARDITERKRAELALARAKDAAVAANRELQSFSYSVAHQLRAPLRGMSGFAQVLIEDLGDKVDADGRACLLKIQSNAAAMSTLIDDLLSLSRVTRSDWRPEPVDLSSVFRSAIAKQAASEPRERMDVVVRDQVFALADRRLMRSLFENLASNGWKFTVKTAEPRIEFGVMEAGGERVFFVRDNGAGFDMAYANKLFAPFQRLHTVAEFPGTGIGLATAARVVARHGGRIWAEGRVGHGAVFYFTLPSPSFDPGAAK
ncbi:MAG TPA: PAS domain S-box protein [Polyangiaceae bacterium]|jgi:PAS domain S-box-containing protein|nr:PAS domain S-box protein [Polyangiaceae bacterium]